MLLIYIDKQFPLLLCPKTKFWYRKHQLLCIGRRQGGVNEF